MQSHIITLQKNSIKLFMKTEELRTLFRNVLNLYIEKDLLQTYSHDLKKFIEDYQSMKLITFLSRISQFIHENQSDPSFCRMHSEKDTAATTCMSLSTQTVLSKSYSSSPRSVKFLREGLKESSKPLSASFDKILDFLKLEVMHKDNFFFEVAEYFGKLYSQQFEGSLYDFEILVEQMNLKSIPLQDLIDEERKSRKEEAYIEGLKDVKLFEELLYNCLKSLMIQIKERALTNETLLPSNKSIHNLAVKIVFGRNKCYTTFFSLIRYSTIEEEVKLKSAYEKLKNSKPGKFGLTQIFSMDKEDYPYDSAVEALDYLDVYTNPKDKFQLIYFIRKQIIKCLDEYKTKQGLINQEIAITGDQLLPLYTYCIIKGSNQKLRAHQVFIESFLDRSVLDFNEDGYCYSTFVGAIDSLVGNKTPRISLQDIQKARLLEKESS